MKLQLLLRREYRNEKTASVVEKLLVELGMRPTAAGSATLSAEIEGENFERLFGRKPEESDSPRGAEALGFRDLSAGADLPVPDPLNKYVATITVAPAYIRMSQPHPDSK